VSEQVYPDVLGAIAGRERLELDTLQGVLGVFPPGVALGQPFEILLLLQSVIDRPQQVNVDVRLPRRDAAGRRLSFFLPKKQIRLTLGPGEVGVLYLPVVVQPPTSAARGYPVQVQVQVQASGAARRVRAPGLGRPPSVLDVSPFRLEVLRDVPFSGKGPQPGQLRTHIDVIPGKVRPGLFNPTSRYDTLWTARDYRRDQERLAEVAALGERVALDFTRGNVFYPLEKATRERFADVGLPLHPGESLFIARALTYVFEDAYQYQYEEAFGLRDMRWFQWLCSLLAQDEDVANRDRGELAIAFYEGAVYDAVRVTLPMVQLSARQHYGSSEEHRRYAEKVVQALQGVLPMDISYAYLPLIMGGVLLNLRLALRDENPWESLDLLDEARRGRARLLGTSIQPLMLTLDGLMQRAREMLAQSRVPRE